MKIKEVLAIRFSIIVAFILLILSISVYEFLNVYRNKEFNERLYKRIERKVNHFINTQKLDSSQFALFYQLNLTSLPHETLHISDEQGKYVFTSEKIDARKLMLLRKLIKEKKIIWESEFERNYLAFIYQNKGKNYYIVASAVDELGYARMKYLRYLLAVLFFAGLAVTAVTGRYYAHRALKPINHIISQVDEITATNLHKRVRTPIPNDEIGTLAQRFNKMLERIEDSFQVQKLFIANASHEFATPLTTIKGEIDVLLMQPRTEAEYVQVLKSIYEEIEKQIQLLNALRVLSDVTNETYKRLQFTSCNISELITDVSSDLIQKKPNYNIQIKLPENDADVLISGNVSLLKACFINVIDNACKFTLDNQAEVHVSVQDDKVYVRVSDKGIGISPEDLKHVFEPFYRCNNTRNIYGFGIGLSLVKKIVELHNGAIHLDSREGEGTTVVLKFKIPSQT